MQGCKVLTGKKFQPMDEFGKKLWKIVARWAGSSGEMNPKDRLAMKLGVTNKTLRERFKNSMTWSLYELKDVYDLTEDSDVVALINEFLKEKP